MNELKPASMNLKVNVKKANCFLMRKYLKIWHTLLLQAQNTYYPIASEEHTLVHSMSMQIGVQTLCDFMEFLSSKKGSSDI